MTRRDVLGRGAALALPAAAALLLSGCSQRMPRVGLTDASDLAAGSLLEALLGPPSARAVTMTAPPEPALLKKGVFESVVVATDVPGFLAMSKGALKEQELRETEERVVKNVNDVLKRYGFSARAVPFPPPALAAGDKTLVATLTPQTEQGGSPAERATGTAPQLLLVRLTITDPATGQALRIRDFYSGRDVGGSPNRRRANLRASDY